MKVASMFVAWTWLAWVGLGLAPLRAVGQPVQLDPIVEGTWPGYSRSEGRQVAVAGGYAYVVGASVSVFDVSRPAVAQWVATWDRSSIGGEPWRIAASAGVVCLALRTGALAVIDTSDPVSPRWVGSFAEGDGVLDVSFSGSLACLAMGAGGLVLLDVSVPSLPTRVGQTPTRGPANRVDVQEGRAYVSEGEQGVEIFDLANPGQPMRLAAIDTAAKALRVAVQGQKLVVAEGEFGLEIFDLADPAHPKSVGRQRALGNVTDVTGAGSFSYSVSSTSGLVSVDIEDPSRPKPIQWRKLPEEMTSVFLAGGYLYVTTGVLAVFDVADPSAPAIVWHGPFGQAQSVTLAGQLACLADWRGGLQVIDCGDDRHPQRVGRWPKSEISESVNTADVAVSGQTAWVVDGTIGLLSIDLTKPGAPIELGRYKESGFRKVVVSGRRGYVASSAGLSIFDLADPVEPRLLGESGGWVDCSLVAVQGDIVCVVATKEVSGSFAAGMYVLDVSDPSTPQVIGQYAPSIQAADRLQALAIQGNLAYLLYRVAGLDIVDLSSAGKPVRLGHYRKENNAGLAISRNLAFLGGATLHVVDVADPTFPQLVAGLDCPSASVAVRDRQVYLASLASGLTTVLLPDWFPQLEAPKWVADGSCRLRFRAQSGQTVRLQHSSDLHAWRDWQTTVASGGWEEILDSDARGGQMRFYRALGVLQ